MASRTHILFCLLLVLPAAFCVSSLDSNSRAKFDTSYQEIRPQQSQDGASGTGVNAGGNSAVSNSGPAGDRDTADQGVFKSGTGGSPGNQPGPAVNASGQDSAGNIYVKPSIMDRSRDTVQNLNIPAGAREGGWVQMNPGGIAHDYSGQPIVGSSGVQMGQAPPSNKIINVTTERLSRMARQVSATDTGRTAVVATDIAGKTSMSTMNVGEGPIVAVLPAGSNMTATWDLDSKQKPMVGFLPPTPVPAISAVASTGVNTAVGVSVVPVILPVGVVSVAPENFTQIPVGPHLIPVGSVGSNTRGVVGPNREPVIMTNRRIELYLLDMILGKSNNQPINQNLNVFVRFSVTAMQPQEIVQRNISQSGNLPNWGQGLPLNKMPASTSGFQRVFNGQYNSATSKTMPLQQYMSQDLCGEVGDKGLLEIMIQPSSEANQAAFPPIYFACAIDLNIQSATRNTESFWSSYKTCQSTPDISPNYQSSLTYQIRQYNINWNQCQQTRPTEVQAVLVTGNVISSP